MRCETVHDLDERRVSCGEILKLAVKLFHFRCHEA
jgi:hypothetical protein